MIPYRSDQLEPVPGVDAVEDAIRALADVLESWIDAHMARTTVGRAQQEQWMHIAAGNLLEAYNAVMKGHGRDERAIGMYREEMTRSFGQALLGVAACCICGNYDLGDVLVAGLEVYEAARIERYGTTVRDRLRRALMKDIHRIQNDGSYRAKLLSGKE